MMTTTNKLLKASLACVLAFSLSVIANVSVGLDSTEAKTNVSVQKKSTKKVKKNIAKAKVTFEIKVFIKYDHYGTKINKPLPIVKYKGKTLTRGKDYKVSWKYHTIYFPKSYDKLKITIKGKGAYKGTKTITKKVTDHWKHTHKYEPVYVGGRVDHYRCKSCGDEVECAHQIVTEVTSDGRTLRYCVRCDKYFSMVG